MPKLFIIGLLFSFLIIDPVASQARKKAFKLTVGKDAKSFHIDINGSALQTYFPNEHNVYFMQDLLHAAGMEEDMLLMEASVNNAYAMVRRDVKLIVYSPQFVDRIQQGDGSNNWIAAHFILGHEIGHHACRHLAGSLSGLPHDKELEADRFAGWMLRQQVDKGMKDQKVFNLPAIERAIAQLLPSEGSSSHPPIERRLGAIREGWNDGQTCHRKS